VLLEAGHQAPERVAQRIVESLRTVVNVGGQPLPITASVGLAVDRTRRPEPVPGEVILLAEQALMEAKASGKDRFAAVSAVPRQLH
jgi:GGDEF domain-containing protein